MYISNQVFLEDVPRTDRTINNSKMRYEKNDEVSYRNKVEPLPSVQSMTIIMVYQKYFPLPDQRWGRNYKLEK